MQQLPSHTQTLLRMEETYSFVGVFITWYESESDTVIELYVKPMLYQSSHEALQKVAFLNQNGVYGKANVFESNGFLFGEFNWRSMPCIAYDVETIPAEMLVRRGQDNLDIYLNGPLPEYARTFGEHGREI